MYIFMARGEAERKKNNDEIFSNAFHHLGGVWGFFRFTLSTCLMVLFIPKCEFSIIFFSVLFIYFLNQLRQMRRIFPLLSATWIFAIGHANGKNPLFSIGTPSDKRNSSWLCYTVCVAYIHTDLELRFKFALSVLKYAKKYSKGHKDFVFINNDFSKWQQDILDWWWLHFEK